MSRRLRITAVLLGLLLLGSNGCITMVHTTKDNPIDPAAVEKLEAGKTTLPQVLKLLGAPLEVHNHADGYLLVYRHQGRNTFRFGISAGQATRFIDASQVISETIGNLRFNLERIHQGEDRLVILFDNAYVLQAASLKRSAQDLPVF